MSHLFSAGLSANPKIKQLYEEHVAYTGMCTLTLHF